MSRSTAVQAKSSLIVREPWRGASPRERLQLTSNLFIFTPPVKELLRQLRLRIDEFPSRKSKRGIVLAGPVGVGKTAIADHFFDSFAESADEEFDRRTVVMTSPPARFDADSFAEAVISACNWPVQLHFKKKMSGEAQMYHVLQQCRTRMLIVTRADFLAPSGESTIAPEAIPFLIQLLDNVVPTIVLVASTALSRKLNSIPNLRGKLTTLRIEPVCYGRRWLKAVEQYDAELPFETGGLTAEGMPEMLHLGSEGNLPLLSGLTVEAARLALFGVKRSDRLLREHFEKAFTQILPAVPNPFTCSQERTTLLAEIARRSNVMLEDFISDEGEN